MTPGRDSLVRRLASRRPSSNIAAAIVAAASWGAAFLANSSPAADPPPRPSSESPSPSSSESPLVASDFQHWAFRPLTRPAPPAVRLGDWPRGPVDVFVLARHERHGLWPIEEADRATLLRRMTFDLTGLPPSAEDVEAFVADGAPDAVERRLDRLLADPACGPRAAQHWLDLARFAETDGFEHDLVRPNAWRYRDWVIDALNHDMPFDEFVRRQLAADLLFPDDPSAAIATGFLLCGPDMPDQNNQDERRHLVLNEMTSTVASSLLGLQAGCAECHDHKYDPISQADFYRLRGFFESLDIFKDHPVPTPSELAATPKTLAKSPTGKKDDGPRTTLGRVVREGTPRSPKLYLRGDFRQPAFELVSAVPRIAQPADARLRPLDSFFAAAPDERDRGRATRRELARWLTQPDHPLFTRVAANRIWQRHFVRGLTTTPADFGLMGEAPSHEPLLDWLAAELPRRDWSVKSVTRMLLGSAAYRQRRRSPEQPAVNSENRLLVGMNPRRLDGEEIRDALLASSDLLVRSAGGPGVQLPLPVEVASTLLKKQWTVSPDPADHHRRSVYLFVRRNLRYPLFDVFDRPDTNASCPQRMQSIIAPQALTMLHSELVWTAAERLAADVELTPGRTPAEQAEELFRRILSHSPTAEQREAADRLLAGLEESLDRRAALRQLAAGLFNLNEFMTID